MQERNQNNKLINIQLHINDGTLFCARADWGCSSWHRDAISAVSELFSLAIPIAQLMVEGEKK